MVTDSDSGAAPSAPAVLDLDHVFNALAHPRRRYLLYTLLAENEWSLWQLSTMITAWEQGVPVEMVTDEEAEPVFVSLYHNHVPKLAEDDIVEFSEASERITPGANATQVLKVLENAGGTIDGQQETHARSDQCEGQT